MNCELYRDKVILAPMVRVGVLPFRLVCLRYGADLVYSDEIIDFKLINSVRKVNDTLNTVDFVSKDGTVVFRTCEEEKSRLILQIGTCDPDRACQVLELFKNDIAGLDINMGCPKDFSTKGGMGSALLDKPDLIRQILTKLVQIAEIPITCKIRILPDFDKTVELVKIIKECKVSAIGIHGRYRSEQSNVECHYDIMKQLSDIVGNDIPLIASGGSSHIACREDAIKFAKDVGFSSVMVARSAMTNPSIFRTGPCLPIKSVIADYLKTAVAVENLFVVTKFFVYSCVSRCTTKQEYEFYNQNLSCSTMSELCKLWDVEYNETKRTENMFKRRIECANGSGQFPTKVFAPSDPKPIELPIDYISKEYANTTSPKTTLHEYCKKNQIALPAYETVNSGLLFRSYVTVNKTVYFSSYLFKNKRSAEQASAKVFLLYNKIEV